ncbi:MAG: hypothetical protein ACP5HG_12985 [Anaerolineae bacterium]
MVKRQAASLRYARPAPPWWELWLDLDQPPAAGAYVLADLGGPLREPLFPSVVDEGGFATMVPPGHAATQLLPGTVVDVLGPLGRGFRLDPPDHSLARLLLIAEVPHLPLIRPLYQLADSVALVVEATTRAQLPSPGQFPTALELTLVTRDGSAGYLGPLEAAGDAPVGLERVDSRLRELLAWTERVCLACDPARYPAFAQMIREVRLQPQPDFAQALVKVSMPCGVGVCDVCRIATRHGERRVCVDGPVFDLLDFLSL